MKTSQFSKFGRTYLLDSKYIVTSSFNGKNQTWCGLHPAFIANLLMYWQCFFQENLYNDRMICHFFPTDLALRCLELNINIGWYWDFLNNFFYFHFATGNCWICIFSHLHSRSYFEDHCIWVFLPFGCLPPQRMEHFRFCNCSSRVSLF